MMQKSHFPGSMKALALALVALMTFTAAQAQYKVAARNSRAILVKHNNPGLEVDLGVGLWGIPIPTDYDQDGRMDLLVSCPDKPYKGLYYFQNIGTSSDPLFAPAKKLHKKGLNNIRVSEVDGKQDVLAKGVEYPNFVKAPYVEEQPIVYEGEVLGATYNKSRSNMWNYADWDNDGDRDIIVGIDTWDDYGWDNAYNAQGEWTRGPLHGYVYWLENVNGNYINRGKVKAGEGVIDTYGAPNPCIADFDGDGDLDLICGEFLDGLTWFENIGTRNEPKFAEGRRLKNKEGEIRFHLEMIVPVVSDFDGDGHADLLVGDEDGRVAWLRHTGKIEGGMPQFESPYYLRQQAELVKFGALATPCTVDWDGDGKEDIVAGNSAGEIALIRNISGGKRPTWGEPELFKVEGKPLRIQAGYNGSIQGPAEEKWGYTVLSVADWDGDGKQDIIINSIWGKIEWLRNPGKSDCLELEAPQPVLVDWKKNKMPRVAWNWWTPEPGTLTTQWRTTPVAMDWNKDGLMDLVVLDTEGYLAYFERFRAKDGRLLLKPGERIFYGTNCSLYDNRKGVANAEPGVLRLNELTAGKSGRRKICFTDWDNDGRLDLIVDSQNAAWFRNVKEEKGKVWYEYMGNVSETILAGHTTCPTTVDWNGDGVRDLLLGAEDGHFYVVRNRPQPIYVKLFPEGTPSKNGLEDVPEGLNEKNYYINVSDPELEIFLPAKTKRPTQAMLVVPGGGYEKVCVTHEGYKTAQWLNEQGIAAFVLKYRMPNGHPDLPLEDAQRAMQIIRERAAEWNINPESVGVIGFSAGGHFVSNLITRYTDKKYRPDFAVLIYPVTSNEYPNSNTSLCLLGEEGMKNKAMRDKYNPCMNVHKEVPPTMIVLCDNDKAVDPRQCVEFYIELKKAGVKSEMHIFPTGGHGFWMRDRYKFKQETYPMVMRWIQQYKESPKK
ncbi:MAG: VCBS repeat-containing protein [Alistipes sp.]|nr:VCBS repeat-containing protein [Alistipes sp.]